MIFSKKVRNTFAGCSSGPVYYHSKGAAGCAFDVALEDCACHLDSFDCTGDEGHSIVAILDDCDTWIGWACLSWYRLLSGRYEFVGYIA